MKTLLTTTLVALAASMGAGSALGQTTPPAPPAATAGGTPGPSGSVWSERKSAWTAVPAADQTLVQSLSEDYRKFLEQSYTELMATAEVRRRAEARGYKLWTPGMTPAAGDKLIFPNRDRSLVLVKIGTEPLLEGARLIATHIDSPRLELKGRPFYQAGELALMQTLYHGGIKKYQWVNVPLALVGRVNRIDGTAVNVRLGLEPGDPVFLIPDSAPHEDKELRERKMTEVIKGEELDPIAGSMPDSAGLIGAVIARLESQYRIEEEDLASAELALVPATPPREVGVDRSLIGGYGQDDKACTFAAVRALLDDERTPRQTVMIYLTDNEEVGSVNATGADAFFLRQVFQSLLSAGRPGDASAGALYHALERSLAVSADVNAGLNPTFASTQEESNASRLGFGVTVKLYGWGTNANSETLALFRRLFKQQGIPWQTHTPRVDVGGGGTIGGFLSRQGIEVIDLGIPVLGLHSPFELTSKADLYFMYRTLRAFQQGGPAVTP